MVALVITIIVLLILAGVSIGILIGQNGILGNAEKAIGKSENAQIQENATLADYENEITSKYVGSTRTEGTSNIELIEKAWGDSTTTLAVSTTAEIDSFSFAGYGTGKAIVSYSVTNSTVASTGLHMWIYKNDLCVATDGVTGTSSTVGKKACATASITYDEDTRLSFLCHVGAVMKATYTYSILIIPD